MAFAVHKKTETEMETVDVNSVRRQNAAEQELATPDGFMAEVQWAVAIRKLIAGMEFGDALGEYVVKPPGKLALVPDSDPRPAVDLDTVADEFTPLE